MVTAADVAARKRTPPVPPGPVIRLSWLARRRLGVWVWCETCGHNTSLQPSALAERLGDCPVPDVAGSMICSRCGGREITTRPDWPSSGTMAGHQPLDMSRRDRLYDQEPAGSGDGDGDDAQHGQTHAGRRRPSRRGPARQSAPAQGPGPWEGEPTVPLGDGAKRKRAARGLNRAKKHCCRPPDVKPPYG
ncbi:MAG: hypothetical protein ACFB6R_16110 [Alphaproteobacteria bacterium]